MASADSITDDELAALAMAADPDVPLDDDAEPWIADDGRAGLLPSWYMPVAVAAGRRRHRVVVAVIIGALLLLNGAGLCVTYGFPEIAW